MDTFAVITTDPNAKMTKIHTRQPVMLEPREYAILPCEDLVIDSAGPLLEEKTEPQQRGLFDGL
jgi:putative SOS response-associated peptidase YedK